MAQKLNENMLASLFEQAKKDGKTFPLVLHLKVGEKYIDRVMDANGKFTEGNKLTGESEMGAERETNGSTK